MSINPLSYPKFKAFNTSTGLPLDGGLLYTYEPGTTTPAITYSDWELTIPNTNPVVLDSNGEAVVYLPSARTLVLKTSAGGTMWTMDYVGQPDPSNVINAADYGVLGSQAAIEAALTAIGGLNRTLYLPPVPASSGSVWAITSSLAIPANVSLFPEVGAVLSVATGQTLTISGNIKSEPYQIFSLTGTGTVALGSAAAKSVYINWWGSNQTALGNALSAIGASNPATLILPRKTGSLAITTAQIIPTNVSLSIEPGATIAISEHVLLTIKGALLANPGQSLFTGSGYVKFSYGKVPEVYPAWWGAVADYNPTTYAGTDNGTAFQKAITCLIISNQSEPATGCCVLKIPAGDFMFGAANYAVGIGNSAQAGALADGFITSYNNAPIIIKGSGRGNTYAGGTRLFRQDGGFVFMVGGEYVASTGVFTTGSVNPGPLTFQDLTFDYAGDRTDGAGSIAGKPMGVGGNLQYSRWQNVNFYLMYVGIDTHFKDNAGSTGDSGACDYASFRSCNFNYSTWRGLILHEPNATTVGDCHFYTPGLATFMDDTNYGPGNAEGVSACGLASYGGNPLVAGCGFDGYGNNTDDYSMYVNNPYTFDCIAVHNESRRLLYSTSSIYGSSIPAHVSSVINFYGGYVGNQLTNGIVVVAAGKVRFMGTQFYLLADTDTYDIFGVTVADLSCPGSKFWRPTGGSPAYAEFTPTNTGAATLYLGDVAGAVATVGTLTGVTLTATGTVAGDILKATSGIRVAYSTAGDVATTYNKTNKLEVFDAAGASLGFIQLYVAP